MPLPLKEFVQQIFAENERAALFFRAVSRAWRTTSAKYPERTRWIRKATFRGLVWEEIVKEISTLAVEGSDLSCIAHRDTMSFILEDNVLFRIKHADLTLATANYPTVEAQDFDNHDIDLYGYTGLQRVELCYVLDEFETKVVWVGIAARSNGAHLWKLELDDTGVAVPPAELPFETEPEADPTRLARVKKPQPKDKGEDKKGAGA